MPIIMSEVEIRCRFDGMVFSTPMVIYTRSKYVSFRFRHFCFIENHSDINKVSIMY